MSKIYILDASALIALIFEEKGMNIVEKHLANGQISAVNWSEVIAYMTKNGTPANQFISLLTDLSLPTIDFNETQAITAGQLIKQTSKKGLSFGDRACLALAMQTKGIALTADKAWGDLGLDVKIEFIR